MLVGPKVCDLTEYLLWFVCGLYVGILTSSLRRAWVIFALGLTLILKSPASLSKTYSLMIGSTAAMTGQKACGQGVNNGRHIGPFGGKHWSLADSVWIDKEIKGYDYSPESEPKWSTPTNMWDDITDISTNGVGIHQHSIIISIRD